MREVDQASRANAPAQAAVHGVADTAKVGLGKVAQPIRVVVSDGAVSPPIDETLVLLGRDRTLARLDAAIDFLDRPS